MVRAMEDALPVRRIAPPKLGPTHLRERIICYRPMRHGAPEMGVREKDGKVIASNYGHGGSGWTLAPSCADHVIDLLANSSHGAEFTGSAPVTVIGAGVLGLFTAYSLHQKGFRNVTIVAEQFDGIASSYAGSLLAPMSMDNDQETEEVLLEIEIDAYKFYESIAKKQHPHFKSGVAIIPAYFGTREDSGLEPYVGRVMGPAKEVTIDFGNGTTRRMVVYDDSIFIDASSIMEQLADHLKGRGITFLQKRVSSFAELEGKVVFNCAGLGARELSGDERLVSVQGHLIMLKDQDREELQYMLLHRCEGGETASGQGVKRCVYFFPKRMPDTGIDDVGVIGGTFIEGATPATPNEEEFAVLLQNARDFFGIK